MTEVKNYSLDIKGKKIEVEIGKVANLANGSCVITLGETVILATSSASKQAKEGIDFLPLTVDVQEKAYALGKLPGGFFKREGRPTTDATLVCRLIDRPLRPLFPKSYHNDTQIIISVLSSDESNPYDALGIIGSSISLAISDIPYSDPVGACVIGYVDEELIVNPTYEELQNSKLNLTVAGTEDAIMMVESGSEFVSESLLLEALKLAQEVNGQIVRFINEIVADSGKDKWEVADEQDELVDIKTKINDSYLEDLQSVVKSQDNKTDKQEKYDSLREKIMDDLSEEFEESDINMSLDYIEKKEIRDALLNEEIRPDGRNFDEIRELTSDVRYLPRVHGSAIFTRGETQIMNAVTLAPLSEAQKLDGFNPVKEKFFIHHYNFPPFSVGEPGRMMTGRREVGHGALAERAVLPVLPNIEDFPYTIRSVSEALSSNGSTSMASVCSASLALMDAGVPIKSPVAGIAMGLITGENDKYVVLTDIQGAEDHIGDMDFKVAGTREGVTALQMDIKVKGITFEIMEVALDKAKSARMKILDHMSETISETSKELSKYAPRITTINVPQDKIGAVIGSGGSTIKGLQQEFDASINIDEDGKVMIGTNNSEISEKVVDAIKAIIKDVEAGDTYDAKVVKIMNFGAFAEVAPGKQGLIHISEISKERVEDVESVLSVGEEVKVKVIKIDRQGRIDLSIKALLGDDQNDTTPKKEKEDDSDNQEEFKSSRKGNRKQLGGNS
ncbi:MAG: polyribonucleotide nucleotidyltransferase [SAR202 cluster bacterium]|jgi:polyribonucleotide nucleotidyltransferase|nr:MAG: polyribonucleotide nucleotidyltransferase [SAR202 cluster bacterium]KAA1298214.1 MAG: polyribonucleotide nucleotidyltransferase [SAR202 cluster bacterium]MQG12439.1 polyribonucleotide nucleotidyltransferase [SAR202 cluster bacterium]|tara:strand:+ start:3688 stop:5880 length:2193 start_codon:yes stop_codon:yes gene_type:complete